MGNKKIAILTQPLGRNYGGILQNFALQRVLEKEKYSVVTVNRIDENPHSHIKRAVSYCKQLFQKKILKKKEIIGIDDAYIYQNLAHFIQSKLNLTKPIEKTVDLHKHFKRHQYDTVIVGSDQTWRPKYSPNIYNYFLDFLSGNKTIRKIAYASSFGTSHWEFNQEETERCRTLVQEFDAISVREESGVELCRKFLHVNAEWVADPTLLLTKEEYLAVANTTELPARKGLFSYILDENDQIVEQIEEIRGILGMEHFTNQPKWRRDEKVGQPLEHLRYPRVEGWLKAFDEADFVVTNSFHGTVFSIIFNKPFVTLVNKERGAARFHSLLGEFGLSHRLINDDEVDIKLIIAQPIDFSYANQKLSEWRNISLSFLTTCLNN